MSRCVRHVEGHFDRVSADQRGEWRVLACARASNGRAVDLDRALRDQPGMRTKDGELRGRCRADGELDIAVPWVVRLLLNLQAVPSWRCQFISELS